MKVGDRIKLRREAKGLSQGELAELIGIHEVTLGRWERGERQVKLDKLQNIAAVLETTTSYLLGEINEADQKTATIEPQPLISIGSSWKALPLYSQMTSACAGIGNGLANADAEIDSWHYFPEEIYGQYNEETPPYMVHVEGDSMEDANIHDGAVAIINPAEEVYDGEAALVCWNRDQVAIKITYWLPDGGVELHSANQEHKKIYTFSREDIMEGHLVIKGKVMWSGQRPKRLR